MPLLDLTELCALTDCAHSRMVGKISGLLAGYAGYSPEVAALIGQAALLHDAGKLDIPPEILNKPSPLSEMEYSVIKTHTRLGADRIMSVMRVLFAAAVIAAGHHEHLDGSGYMGLSGESIHPYARLVAVADVYDAMISRRCYKEALSAREACGYIQSRAGTQFDAEIAAILISHADEVLALYQ